MNVIFIHAWQAFQYSSDCLNCTQTHQSDHWHEHWTVFIYPRTFFLISKLVDIMERADGDSYI